MGENQDNFYVTLFSNSSMKAYPNNSIAAFTVQLAHEIVLSVKDAWEVAVCEFSCPPPKTGTIAAHVVIGTTNAIFYCNLICPQFVGSKKVRCLRTFIHPSVYCNLVFENPYYRPLEHRTFRDISISVMVTSGRRVAFKDNHTPAKVVLHFRRVLRW